MSHCSGSQLFTLTLATGFFVATSASRTFVVVLMYVFFSCSLLRLFCRDSFALCVALARALLLVGVSASVDDQRSCLHKVARETNTNIHVYALVLEPVSVFVCVSMRP